MVTPFIPLSATTWRMPRSLSALEAWKAIGANASQSACSLACNAVFVSLVKKFISDLLFKNLQSHFTEHHRGITSPETRGGLKVMRHGPLLQPAAQHQWEAD